MPRLALSILAATLVTALPALAGPARVGQTAPGFSLPQIPRGTLALDKFHGKPVYLNFFASWCPPCNEEAPAISALYRKYHGKGLQTIGIDWSENADKARGFSERYHLPFPVTHDDDGAVGRDYGTIGLPVHVFIDRRGKISALHYGEMNPVEIEAALKKIL